MATPTNRDSDKFMLRLPDGMRERIKDAAEANSRSMNAEIVARLDSSFAPREGSVTMNLNIELSEIDEPELIRKLQLLNDHLRSLNARILPVGPGHVEGDEQ